MRPARNATWLVLTLLTTACAAPAPRAAEVPDAGDSVAPIAPLTTRPGRAPVAVALGDAVCARGDLAHDACRHERVAALIDSVAPDVVLMLGDLQYEEGTLSAFRLQYEPSFGRFKSITRPVPGNHEYFTTSARGYFDYFNGTGQEHGIAGARKRGFYSFELGRWHVVAINSNCEAVGGCGAGSAQERWLRDDLVQHPAACTLAYWHHARFSSGLHGDDPRLDAIWQVLVDARADLIVTAHDHDYERFAPQDAFGGLDSAAGIRSFVVGTGGKNQRGWAVIRPNSEIRRNDTFGLLRLTLDSAKYDWRFVDAATQRTVDEGVGRCRGRLAER